MNAPGQAERPASPHFKDLAERWARGESVPFAFSEDAVRGATAETLTLVPAAHALQRQR